MREFLRRGGWIFLALLFVVTGLGVGVYAFVVNTKSGPNSNYINCPIKPVTAKQQTLNGKYQGAKLAGFTPVKHIDYLQCQDLKAGSGVTATASSTITATYTGALANTGVIFQSSLDTGQPFTTQLGSGVIAGWTAGIPGMKAGGTRRLLIPAQYAYGTQGSCQVVDPSNSAKCQVYSIPPNADLVFDITLISVK
jgi:FKBP-type peptidyl-prolyl cis-trans isomerase